MGIIKDIIYKFDLFYSGSFLRVRREPQHKTLIGGIVSMTLLIILVATFYNRIINTLNKVVIYSSSSISNAFDPVYLKLSSVGSRPFMIGVEVFGFNLNQRSRYFDIQMRGYYDKDYGRTRNMTDIFLEACNIDHWSGYPQIQDKFDQLNMNNWKCLPKGLNLQLKGTYSSEEMITIVVQLRACTNRTTESSQCASQDEIEQYFNETGTNYFSIYFMNPLLNPDDQDYLTYYLDGSNYITFSSNYGGQGLIFVEDYSISTDKSIFPISNIQTVSGGIINKPAIKNTYIKKDQTYAIFVLLKSSTSNNIKRSFQKLDEVLSYIGGLFGTVLILFFFLGTYNTYKFEVNLAGYLYRTQREEEGKIEKDYNFIYFVGQTVYSLLRLFRLRPNWDRLRRYHQIREEMVKQLDILFLIKRVAFLEKSLTFLFSGPQLTGLHLTEQPTLNAAIETRRNYRLKTRLIREIQNIQKQSMIKSTSSMQQFTKNNSIQFTDLQEGSIIKYSIDGQRGSLQDYNADSEDYSSDEYSEQDEKRSLINEINELLSDNKSMISRNIWQGIDIRLKPRSSQRGNRNNDENKEKGSRQGRPESKEKRNAVPNTPFAQQYESSLHLQSLEVAKQMSSKLQIVKTRKEQFIFRDDDIQEIQ